ncbi:MAG TPA: zinc-binding dehydrogenase, partial [Mycobacteriales bacterium]|nr:zinc-binding dehydrogenase [Mycobacteriales bacterium]
MSRRLVISAPGRAELVDEADPKLADGQVRIGTAYTGLSAGTELSWFKGTNPFLGRAFDRELGLFSDGEPNSPYPVRRVGYMETGVVTESRAPGLPVGTRVAAPYGHASGHVADPATEHVVPLPGELDPVLGVYVSHMGPICANGVLHAAADAVSGDVRGLGDGVAGRRVLVTGVGVVGLLTGLFALHHGAAEVVAVDATDDRLKVAERLGMVPMADSPDVPRQLKRRWRHGAGDHGADVAFQCRGQAGALATALASLRPQATVVDLAFYQGGADLVRLGEEFHHNGLGIRCAQIGRVPRGLAHRWDRDRLSRA